MYIEIKLYSYQVYKSLIHCCCFLFPSQVKARGAKKGAAKAASKKKPSKGKKKVSFRRGGKKQPKVANGLGCPEVGYPEQITRFTYMCLLFYLKKAA